MSHRPSSRPHTRDRRTPATLLDANTRASAEPGTVQPYGVARLGAGLEQPLEDGKVGPQRPPGVPQEQRLGQAEEATRSTATGQCAPGTTRDSSKVRTPPDRRGPEMVLTARRRLGSYSVTSCTSSNWRPAKRAQ